MSTFRCQSEKIHLTYKTHLDKDAYIPTLPPYKMLSFVHEASDTDHPYDHTHVFVWFQKKLNTTDPRFFDFNEIHPNWKIQRSIVWAKTICLKYHHGYKSDGNGKIKHVPPVFLFQEGIDEWKFQESMIQVCREAPTLDDALMSCNVFPKSVSDVISLRRIGAKRKSDSIDEGADPSKFVEIDWNRSKALIVQGTSGTGKTNWALYQFKKPLKIDDLDDLKDMPEDTDGLVFDECLFDKCAKKTMIALLDIKQPRTVRTRNTNARIPAKLPRIFCCNEHEHPFGNNPDTGGHESVTSRFESLWAYPGTLVRDPTAR